MPDHVKWMPRRRITVTSSFNEIPTDQLGNRLMVRGECITTPPAPLTLYTGGFWTDIQRRHKRFSSILVICFMPGRYIRSELEFLKSLWGLGTEEEQGYRTGPQGYIDSLESIPGPHKQLKIRAGHYFFPPCRLQGVWGLHSIRTYQSSFIEILSIVERRQFSLKQRQFFSHASFINLFTWLYYITAMQQLDIPQVYGYMSRFSE